VLVEVFSFFLSVSYSPAEFTEKDEEALEALVSPPVFLRIS